jgi:hypothetical protein
MQHQNGRERVDGCRDTRHPCGERCGGPSCHEQCERRAGPRPRLANARARARERERHKKKGGR